MCIDLRKHLLQDATLAAQLNPVMPLYLQTFYSVTLRPMSDSIILEMFGVALLVL